MLVFSCNFYIEVPGIITSTDYGRSFSAFTFRSTTVLHEASAPAVFSLVRVSKTMYCTFLTSLEIRPIKIRLGIYCMGDDSAHAQTEFSRIWGIRFTLGNLCKINYTVNYNNSLFTKFKYFVSVFLCPLFRCREGLHTILKPEEATSTMVVWS